LNLYLLFRSSVGHWTLFGFARELYMGS
jgi:hypothetical protein